MARLFRYLLLSAVFGSLLIGAWRLVVPRPTAEGGFVAFVDVGQGDAAVIRFSSGETVVIDGGPGDQARKLIAKLDEYGVTSVDLMIATHPHSDHIDGLTSILRSMRVAEVWHNGLEHATPSAQEFQKAMKESSAKIVIVRKGRSAAFDGGRIDVLAPIDPLLRGTTSDANNNSIVARVTLGNARFLFTGDMQEEQRRQAYLARADLRTDVLKIAHHGSADGTDSAFLRRVRPKLAVISCGDRNVHGHPHRETIEALRKANVPVRRTDQDGTIVITPEKGGLRIFAEKSKGG